MLFRYFGVTEHQELKALQWGIYGAMLLRLVFILFGITLIHLFHPVIYAFGALLLWTSYKMLKSKDVAADPGKMVLLRILPKFFQMQKEYHGDRFFVKKAGRLWATPMIALVIAVESSDVMFAIDSIPAILAITTDPFIVFSSNIFAVLGLRSLFFLLSKLLKLFHHLKYGVALILAFVGVKMMLSDVLHIPIAVSLGTIAIILSVTILSSILARNKNKADKKKL
jgi:tellurite resistance protein TerC